MSARILVVYGTSYGQTAKVADRIHRQLLARDIEVFIANVAEMSPNPDLVGFDGVIVAASVIRGRHQRAIERFARSNASFLNAHPSAFVSVSASAAGRDLGSRLDAQRAVDDFVRRTGWTPQATALVAGAMAFTKYSWPVRWVLKRISASHGGPTDTSRDHELTDWTQVESFARDFARRVSPSDVPAAAP